jgi:hypothetical protein
MIFCDYFVPTSEIRCFVCQEVLTDWDSNDGPCLDLVFTQGRPDPELSGRVDLIDENGNPLIEATGKFSLPDDFFIYSSSCACTFGNRAKAYSENGVWVRTELFTGSAEDRQIKSETKEQYRRHMKWLGTIKP